MEQLSHTVIELPKAAFMANPRRLQLNIGDSWEKIHNFFLDTRANYTEVKPIQSRHPKRYHFSTLPCHSPKFRETDIITVEMEKDKVTRVLLANRSKSRKRKE